jgi:hypothetical protein
VSEGQSKIKSAQNAVFSDEKSEQNGSKISLGLSTKTNPLKRISNRRDTINWHRSGTDVVYTFDLQM